MASAGHTLPSSSQISSHHGTWQYTFFASARLVNGKVFDPTSLIWKVHSAPHRAPLCWGPPSPAMHLSSSNRPLTSPYIGQSGQHWPASAECPLVAEQPPLRPWLTRWCMHRRVFIKKTWLYAFSYAQSHISLVFCGSLGFLVPWFSPWQLNRVGGYFVLCMEKKVGGLYLFVCKNYISLTCLNDFFAIFKFDNI